MASGAATSRAEALAWLTETFDRAGIEEPKREARLALCEAGGLQAASLIAAPETALGERAAVRLADVATRRAAGEPLSKITGRREFWGLTLAVSADVLDPRPETETLVEAALKLIGLAARGTGCASSTSASARAPFSARCSRNVRRRKGVGVDASPAAVEVARGNIDACGFSAPRGHSAWRLDRRRSKVPST